MTEKLKLYAYAVLIILGIWFGWRFYSSFSVSTQTAAPTSETATLSTNDLESGAITALTNAPGSTNAPDPSSNAVATTPAPTNAAVASTNSTTAPPVVSPSNSQAKASITPAEQKKARGSMFGSLVGLVAVLVLIGLLAAHDFSQFMGGRAVDFIFDEKGEEHRDPEYERAEQVWANGNALEAIQIMRDYLKEHPNKQYVALRIAEIYEKDLNNFLAAALEYEEILKQKLPAERWGWAAIHLCNLYSRTGQQQKSAALLERIATEYPGTAAAQKARSRLGMAEPEAPAPASPEENAQSGDEAAPKSNLPPGFRPKK